VAPDRTSESGAAATPRPERVVVFDGVCPFCVGWVRRAIQLDRAGRLRFAPKQTEGARRRLLAAGCDPDLVESIVLIEGDRVWTQSDAALRIIGCLPFPHSLPAALRIVPRALRDFVYGVIARNRFRWFGRRDACYIPSAEVRSRFVD